MTDLYQFLCKRDEYSESRVCKPGYIIVDKEGAYTTYHVVRFDVEWGDTKTFEGEKKNQGEMIFFRTLRVGFILPRYWDVTWWKTVSGEFAFDFENKSPNLVDLPFGKNLGMYKIGVEWIWVWLGCCVHLGVLMGFVLIVRFWEYR